MMAVGLPSTVSLLEKDDWKWSMTSILDTETSSDELIEQKSMNVRLTTWRIYRVGRCQPATEHYCHYQLADYFYDWLLSPLWRFCLYLSVCWFVHQIWVVDEFQPRIDLMNFWWWSRYFLYHWESFFPFPQGTVHGSWWLMGCIQMSGISDRV